MLARNCVGIFVTCAWAHPRSDRGRRSENTALTPITPVVFLTQVI
jgi:hypothetical protein